METKTFLEWIKYFDKSLSKKVKIITKFRCSVCGEEDKSKQNKLDETICNSCYDKSIDVILY